MPEAWARMQEAELEVPFATLFGKALQSQALTGEAADIALRVGLLSPYAETVAKRHKPASAEEAFLLALAAGDPSLVLPPDSLGRAIATAFREPRPRPRRRRR